MWSSVLTLYDLLRFFADSWNCAKVRIIGGLFSAYYPSVIESCKKLHGMDNGNPTCWSPLNKIEICPREPFLGQKGGYLNHFRSSIQRFHPQYMSMNLYFSASVETRTRTFIFTYVSLM
eukprot:gb/GEZJ01007213.1/.p2 GENE.gb/GEZJ01007213.1/~~gb/GEZJ01007213.1/.p2  ORF type:complete len:119 (+),score=3.53 gb/GEZJ01007213.1/:287-643(+)